MSSKLRIPKMAAVSLVFGGACGSDGEGINVSASRIDSVAESYCRHWAECYRELFEELNPDPSECVPRIKRWVDEYVESSSDACVNAVLGAWECEHRLACGDPTIGVKCEKARSRFHAECPDPEDH